MSNSFRYLTSTGTDQQQEQQSHFHKDHQQTLLPCAGADTNIDLTNPDKVPLASNNHHDEEGEERMAATTTTTAEDEIPDSFNQNDTVNLDQDSDSTAIPNSHHQLSPGLSLLQAAAASSPPPHSYRHSRAYRHFKNPPQPHMCIRTTTETGEELFINVLSWTRIVIPQEPSDPIPLYGGMRVPPGSPRSPPIVFAVMANPEVLKDSGRHSKDPEERRAMVELMCDFVEAMNPGVKLVRNAVILKDRDISGELKDVWNAVQAQRDREREEQMLQQRQQQQQHYHNLSTNAATNGGGVGGLTPSGITPQNHPQQQQMFSKSGIGLVGEGTPPRSRKLVMPESQMNEEHCGNVVGGDLDSSNAVPLAMLAEQLDNKIAAGGDERQQSIPENLREENQLITNDALSNGNEFRDSTDSNVSDGGHHKNDLNNQLNANNCATTLDAKSSSSLMTNGTNGGSSSNANNAEISVASSTTTSVRQPNATAAQPTQPTTNSTTTTTTITPTPQPVNTPAPPTKKEKLGGFLPNGCIFPRFTKNNKHKDKDKEGKTKDKEKNVLLSALKKSKDKKAQASAAAAAAAAANANQEDKQQQQQKELINTNNTSATTIATTSTIITANTTTTTQQSSTAPLNNHHYSLQSASKNCLQQLECEVQKLDLNHIDSNKSTASSIPSATATNNSANSATATTTSNNANKTGVGVH